MSIPATAAMEVMIIRITTKTSDNVLIVYSIFSKLCGYYHGSGNVSTETPRGFG
ncbi:hypothetical protein PHAGEALMA_189 [Escherichia phage vB_Eco_Alma]|nr:hypothetical protein PHAGEALMA_189 [Escherichia phage vB_Eco_Alma]